MTALAPSPVPSAPPAVRVLLNAREAADALDVSERTLRDLTAPRGPIPPVRVGRLVKYRLSTLEAYAADLEAAAAAEDAADASAS